MKLLSGEGLRFEHRNGMVSNDDSLPSARLGPSLGAAIDLSHFITDYPIYGRPNRKHQSDGFQRSARVG